MLNSVPGHWSTYDSVVNESVPPVHSTSSCTPGPVPPGAAVNNVCVVSSPEVSDVYVRTKVRASPRSGADAYTRIGRRGVI